MLRIDSNLIWIIVNLLIFYFLIRKFLFKPVLNIIEKRKQMVTEQFEKADAIVSDRHKLQAFAIGFRLAVRLMMEVYEPTPELEP